MFSYVVLLRGINLGGHKRVAMADLRNLLTGLGCTGVRTHLQSGNAVVTSRESAPEALARRIENGIQGELGLSVRCLVWTSSGFRAVFDGNPLGDEAVDGSRMMVLFLSQAPDPELAALHDPTALAPRQVFLGDRVIYQWCPDGLRAAPAVGSFVEKQWKVTVTARNWNTVSKLAALLG